MSDIRAIHAEVQQALQPDIPIRIVRRSAVLPPARDELGYTAPRRTAPPLTLSEPVEPPTRRTRRAHDEAALTLLCLALLCLAASVLLIWLLLSFGS